MPKIDFRLSDISEAAKAFVVSIGSDRIFLFQGEMGAGKTTFISEICRILGVEDSLGSPTFSLVNEYGDANGDPIYHFDLYRIDSPREAFDMGAEEYFNSGCLCLVEWPDRLGDFIPEEARYVNITVNSDGSRTISF